MTFEYILGSGSDDSNHHGLGQRMRRAKALLKQAHRQDGEEEGGGGEEEQEQQNNNNNGEIRKHHKKGAWAKLFGNQDVGGNDDKRKPKRYKDQDAHDLLTDLDQAIVTNKDGGIRWTAPYLLLPPIQTAGRQLQQQNDDEEMTRGRHKRDAVNPKNVDPKSEFFKVKRRNQPDMAWEAEYQKLSDFQPPVDYVTHAYDYPELLWELPDLHDHGKDYPSYPPLKPLGDLMKAWPQDNDFPGAGQRPIPEGLLHFNYSNPKEVEMARKFRDAELPFKFYDVPEVTAATEKWTDEYVAMNFDAKSFFRGGRNQGSILGNLLGGKPNHQTLQRDDSEYASPPPPASGTAQESPNNFFAFFQPNLWDVKTMGLPPVRNNDWTFAHWAEHARYADAVGLNASKPHFYWQSGVPREERHLPKSQWTFISRDLPSFSSPAETFFVFNPDMQKGIQCRFGERGVVAATHYDSGRNMIAMVTGAKRYVLAPPKECPSLGIVPWKFNSEFRHSLLNFGHINYMNQTPKYEELDDGEVEKEHGREGGDENGQQRKRQWKGDHMSQVEREWMEIASSSKAIETVLKAGEVLYLPSHWFHYIVSLQKSAQCNVRSGIHDEGTPAFGGKLDVKMCGRLSEEEAANH